MVIAINITMESDLTCNDAWDRNKKNKEKKIATNKYRGWMNTTKNIKSPRYRPSSNTDRRFVTSMLLIIRPAEIRKHEAIKLSYPIARLLRERVGLMLIKKEVGTAKKMSFVLEIDFVKKYVAKAKKEL